MRGFKKTFTFWWGKVNGKGRNSITRNSFLEWVSLLESLSIVNFYRSISSVTAFTSLFETTLWNITNTRTTNRLSTMKHMLNVWSESLKKWVHFMTKFCWRKILKMLKKFWRICFNAAINPTITLNIFVIILKYSNCWIRNCQVIVLKSHSCLKILDVRSIFKKKRRI